MTFKKTALFLSMLLTIFSSFAQSSLGTLTFSNGPSIPVGHFGQNRKPSDGAAETGTFTDLTFRYKRPASAFGIVVDFRIRAGQVHNLFPGVSPWYTLSNGQSTAVTPTPAIPANPYAGYSTVTRSAPLVTAAILIGPGYTTTLGSHWSIESELLIGFSRASVGKSTKKGIKPYPDEPGNADIFYSETLASKTTGYTVVLKAGPAFRLNESVAFFINGDYWYIHSKMTGINVTQYGYGLVLPYYYQLVNAKQFAVSSNTNNDMRKNPATIEVLAGVRVSL